MKTNSAIEHTATAVQRKMALIAGWSLIIMALIAGYAYGYAFQSIYPSGDASATIGNLPLFTRQLRLIIYAFTVVILLDIVAAWALYYFFSPVNEPLSRLSAWLRIAGALCTGAALVNLITVLHGLDAGPVPVQDVNNGFKSFLDMWAVGLVLFGCHLSALGCLAVRSGRIPKVIGILVHVAATCYIFTSSAQLLMSDYGRYKSSIDAFAGIPMALGELSIAFWLIIKGSKPFRSVGPIAVSAS